MAYPKGTKKFFGSLPDRMAFYTDRRGPDECWLWLGTSHRGTGYGRVSLGNGHGDEGAHRVAWKLTNGPIPDGFDIDHECHNLAVERGECIGDDDCPHRLCVNPAHLVARLPRDNILRGNGRSAQNARRTHCRNCGLPLSGDNLVMKQGRRVCANCKRSAWRDWYERVGRERRRAH